MTEVDRENRRQRQTDRIDDRDRPTEYMTEVDRENRKQRQTERIDDRGRQRQ